MKNISEISFYKEIYLDELKRKDRIDTLISYPTTLLTILIGAGLYFLKNENFKFMNECETTIIKVLISLFFISVGFAVFFLMRMFLNKFKKYKYLPLSLDLYNRELEIVEYFKNNSENIDENKILQEAKEQFESELMNYYVSFATKNQLTNDARLKDFYISRKVLMLSLILLSIIGILIFIIK